MKMKNKMNTEKRLDLIEKKVKELIEENKKLKETEEKTLEIDKEKLTETIDLLMNGSCYFLVEGTKLGCGDNKGRYEAFMECIGSDIKNRAERFRINFDKLMK